LPLYNTSGFSEQVRALRLEKGDLLPEAMTVLFVEKELPEFKRVIQLILKKEFNTG